MRLALVLIAVALACSGAAQARTLYKWTDAEGKVQYGDRPPKNFKGEVTRIETDPPVSPAPAPKPPAMKAEEAKVPPPPAEDLATKRREERRRLAANVSAARQRLEAARKALEEAGAPREDERQIVQQHFARGTAPANARSNCIEVVRDGKKSMMCPALVPNEGYYSRITGLEEAVKRAEEDVAEAERAYRRGAD